MRVTSLLLLTKLFKIIVGLYVLEMKGEDGQRTKALKKSPWGVEKSRFRSDYEI